MDYFQNTRQMTRVFLSDIPGSSARIAVQYNQVQPDTLSFKFGRVTTNFMR